MMQPQHSPHETGDKIALASVLVVVLFPVALLLGLYKLSCRPIIALSRLVRHGPAGEGKIVVMQSELGEESSSFSQQASTQYSPPPFRRR